MHTDNAQFYKFLFLYMLSSRIIIIIIHSSSSNSSSDRSSSISRFTMFYIVLLYIFIFFFIRIDISVMCYFIYYFFCIRLFCPYFFLSSVCLLVATIKTHYACVLPEVAMVSTATFSRWREVEAKKEKWRYYQWMYLSIKFHEPHLLALINRHRKKVGWGDLEVLKE